MEIRNAEILFGKAPFGGALLKLIEEHYECFEKGNGYIRICSTTPELIDDLEDLVIY